MATREDTARRIETVGGLSVLALCLLGYVGSIDVDVPRFALSVLTLLFLPGYLIAHLIWPARRWTFIQWVSISVCLSLGVDCALAWVFQLGHLSAGLLLWTLWGVVLALLVLRVAGVRRVPPPADQTRPPGPRFSGPSATAVTVLAVAVSLLLLLFPVRITYEEDALAHIGVMNEILATGNVLPQSSLYPGEETVEDPRMGLLIPVFALLWKSSGTEIHQLWPWLRSVFAFVWVLSFFLFATSILGDERKGLVAAVLFVLLYGGQGRFANILKALVYPSRIGMCAYWTAVHVFLEHARRRERSTFWVAALMVPIAAFVHVTPFINLWVTLAALALFLFVLGSGDRSLPVGTARILAIGTLFTAPYLVQRYLAGATVANPIHVFPQNVLHLEGGWLLPSPMRIYAWFTWAGLAAIPLGLSLARRARRDAGLMILFSSTVAALFLIAVPPVFTLSYRLVNFLANRFYLMIPHVTILAFFLSEAAGDVRRGAGRAVRALAFMAVLVLLMIPAVRKHLDFYVGPFLGRQEVRESPLDLAPALDTLQEIAPGRSVVLSDPLTSYAIAALTDHRVVAIPMDHSPPYDSLSVSRIFDAALALHPERPLEEALETVRRNHASYLVLNQTHERYSRQYGFAIDPARFEAQRAKFENDPERFKPVTVLDGVYIFEISPAVRESVPGGTRGAPRVSLCPDRIPPTEPAVFENQFRLLGARVLDAQVSRGGRLGIVCCWERFQEARFEVDYLIHVRFNREDYPKGPFWREGYAKPYRKILERIRGERYRFRADRYPAEEGTPATRWPLGQAVVDSFVVPVAVDLAPGRYEVGISLNRRPVGGDLDFKDFLSDHDRYEGVKIGSVEIR